MQAPQVNLDQWFSAVLRRWTQGELGREGVRAEVFDLMALPLPPEDVEALSVFFDIVFEQFANKEISTGRMVETMVRLVTTSHTREA